MYGSVYVVGSAPAQKSSQYLYEETALDPDRGDVSRFGHAPQLCRGLSLRSAWCLCFCALSPVLGALTPQGLGFGLATAGPVFLWGLFAVLVGQLVLAAIFAELTVEFPLSAGLYQVQ